MSDIIPGCRERTNFISKVKMLGSCRWFGPVLTVASLFARINAVVVD